MATSRYIEYCLGLIKDYLAANLNAKLLAIETEIGDGLSLGRPLATSYHINEIEELVDFPAIMILPDTADIIIPGGTWDETDYNIVVSCHVTAALGQIKYCAQKAYRYERAIRELILSNRTLSSNVVSWYVQSINYGVMMEDGNGFLQSININTLVKREETAS